MELVWPRINIRPGHVHIANFPPQIAEENGLASVLIYKATVRIYRKFVINPIVVIR